MLKLLKLLKSIVIKSDTSCISMIMFYRNSRGLSLYVSFFKRIGKGLSHIGF